MTRATPLPHAVRRPTGPFTLSIHPTIGSLIVDMTVKQTQYDNEMQMKIDFSEENTYSSLKIMNVIR